MRKVVFSRRENGALELAALGNKTPFILLPFSALKNYTNMNMFSVNSFDSQLAHRGERLLHCNSVPIVLGR